jgi:hypothetical protein
MSEHVDGSDAGQAGSIEPDSRQRLSSALAGTWGRAGTPAPGSEYLCDHGFHHSAAPHSCDWGNHDDICPYESAETTG